jgi:murein DD-endopeptidase MepM/ murein hydrolase activator NlpD
VASYSQTAATYVNYLGAIQWPFLTGVPISTDFGYRVAPCGGCSSYHKGIDMNPGVNSPIQAIADGVVREVSATDNGGLGVYAVIDHTIDGELVSSVYAHMAEGSLALSVGQTVSVGDLVGNVGNTGQSTGPHLHFEILLDGVTPTDPFAWLSERVVP